jgi:hypothetical protein
MGITGAHSSASSRFTRWVYGLTLLTRLLVMAACIGLSGGASAAPVSSAQKQGEPIVVQNFYYALPGKAEEVYQWRLHASEVRARLGLAVGRVLRLTSTGGAKDAELPDVVWECEYPNAAARAADLAKLDASTEFDAVEAHMRRLIRQFRRGVFIVPAPLP